MIYSINCLPNELLEKIFKCLPLRDLFQIELVCTRWKPVHELCLAQITSITLYTNQFAWFYDDFYKLMFFEPLNYSPLYNRKSVRIYEVTLQIAHYLVRKLPNVVKFCQYETIISDEASYYLFSSSWSSQLTQLNFFHGDAQEFDWTAWWPLVRSMKSLKHLAVYGISIRPSDYSIFSQLETLFLDNKFYRPLVGDIFYNIGPTIQSISLTNFDFNSEDLHIFEAELKKNPNLARRLTNQITRLTIQAGPFDVSQHNVVHWRLLNFIQNHFELLKHLDIHIHHDLRLQDIVLKLARLSNLESLRLYCTDVYRYKSSFFNNVFRADGFPMCTVKRLHLAVGVAPHTSFYRNDLSPTFPYLQELHFEYSGQVYRCNCEVSEEGYQDLSAIFMGIPCRDCPENLFESLCEIKSLHKLYRNTHVIFDRSQLRDNVEDYNNLQVFKRRLCLYGTSPYRHY